MKLSNAKKRRDLVDILKTLSSASSWIEDIMDDKSIKNRSDIQDRIDNFFVEMGFIANCVMKLIADMDKKMLPKTHIQPIDFVYEDDWAGLN